MKNFSWDTTQYNKFSQQRMRPALDLLRVVSVYLEAPQTIWDLGCGTGNITAHLAQKWPQSTVLGIDSSSDMLASCYKDFGNIPTIKWKKHNLESWDPANNKADLIFSNAVFQWLPNHEILINRFLKKINEGGCIAVQIPNNWNSPSHTFAVDVLSSSNLLTSEIDKIVRSKRIESQEFYYDLLSPHASHVDIWTTEYLHILEGDDPVFEWIQGTSLRPILESLQFSERNSFLEACRRRLGTLYPKTVDGNTLYSFRRMFFVALF